MKTRRLSTATLLYWLLVVAGLSGVTLVRSEDTALLGPLWLGTIGGVLLGQALGWLRIRAWVLLVTPILVCWLAVPFAFALYNIFGSAMGVFFLAFVPALIGGYTCLSERGGVVAFWYPAVLWMLFVLDASGGKLDARGSTPFVIALGVLFMSFLAARETRRADIWQTEGSVRIAQSVSRTVLRASPARSAMQGVWTLAMGAVALGLAVWIAPHLWEKEQTKHANGRTSSSGSASGSGDGPPCCHAPEQPGMRIKEWFPLRGESDDAHRESELAKATSCNVCWEGEPIARGAYSGPYGTVHGDDDSFGYGTAREGYAAGGEGSETEPAATTPFAPYDPYAPVTPVAAAEPAPTPVITPVAPLVVPAVAAKPHGKRIAKPIVLLPPPPPPPPAVIAEPPPAQAAALPPPPVVAHRPPARPAGVPWNALLAACAGLVVLRGLFRIGRRSLTVRHLARPFWNETLDQRISNHWERVLVGLRDAGIEPRSGETPGGFAKRVGIDGMATCAAILERVRHGVRVEATDLESMKAAAATAFAVARRKAGLAGRAAAAMRWPLT